MTYTIFVPGDPKPQPRPRARVIRNKSGKYMGSVYSPQLPWRLTVRDELERHRLTVIDGPVRVLLEFRVRRPISHFGSGRNARIRKASAPAYPTSQRTGDVDNLAKAVLDEMNGRCFADDSQVVVIEVRKQYTDNDPPGVRISYQAHDNAA